MIAMVNRKWLALRRLVIIWLWTVLVLAASASEDGNRSHTIRLNRSADGSFEINTPGLSVCIDSDMCVTPALISTSGRESLIVNGATGETSRPQQYVKIAGSPVTSFSEDAGQSDALEITETVHGRGKRFRMWATAETHHGCRLRKTVTIDIYERYPQTVLLRTRYVNVGDAPVRMGTYYEASLRLDGLNLWAFHPGDWIWGEDFLFPIEPGVELTGSNIGVSEREDDYRIFGGGLPAVCFLGPHMTLTLGYIAPKIKMLRFPIRANGNGVSVGIERDIGLGQEKAALAPGDTLATVTTFISLHQGDFYEGVRVMSRLHEDIGLSFRDPPIADLTAPAWSNRGNGSAWDKQYILEHLPPLRQYGIKWIHMGDPWQDNLGDYGVSERFADPEDLRRFLRRLHDEGFHVTAFFSDLLVDCESRVVEEHPEYLVRLENGSLLRVHSFGKSHYVLCPAYPPAREFVRRASEKLAGYYGFDGVKNDGHTVPLPCFNPAHKHQYPEQSLEDYPLMQKTVYETFARLKPEGFVVAFCFDGVVPFFYHHHYETRPWCNSDQTSEKQSRWKQKLCKAIFGPTRTLLDDHSDVKYLTGKRGTWYLGPVSGLAMGSVLETAIGPGYDYKSHHYDDIFATYHREKLPEGGEYLNLYNVIHDKPECHVVRKGGALYFGFFANKFDGTLELRGLQDGTRYRVVDYLHGREYPDVNATGSTARLDMRFDSYLLLKLDAVP